MAALLVGVVAAVVVILGSSSTSYTIHARFVDAGQLVNGDLVQVGGRTVGTVSDIRLTNDNQADIVLHISDGQFEPLHQGTQATIRTVGLIGVANRFVDITPGPLQAPKIPDGGVLPTSATRPIIDLDQLLNALDAPTRRHLQGILRNGAEIFAGHVPAQANAAIAYLNPALSETGELGSQLVRDQAALDRLLSSAGTVSSALASRQADLRGGVTHTADVLQEIAAQRTALQDVLSRAPSVLRQAGGGLRDVRQTLTVLDSFLKPLAPKLPRFLRLVVPTARAAEPALVQATALLKRSQGPLGALPGVARTAVPALNSTTSAIRVALPLVSGLRPYTPDLIAGLFNGFGGSTSGSYDANGQFMRVSLELGQGGGLTNPLSLLVKVFSGSSGAGATGGLRTGLTARCPGGAVEPAPDNSNPFDQRSCNPADNHR